ncbi:MAG: hypothetical protein R2839_11270 [Thermomicrobiales bacterium]
MWAYRDINARSQSVVTQIVGTLLVVLFSIPGALLYLLLRPKETLDEAYQRSLEEEYLLQDLEESPCVLPANARLKPTTCFALIARQCSRKHVLAARR